MKVLVDLRKKIAAGGEGDGGRDDLHHTAHGLRGVFLAEELREFHVANNVGIFLQLLVG